MAAQGSDTTGMTMLGSWTTRYIPSTLNGFGANITVPADRIDGMRVAARRHGQLHLRRRAVYQPALQDGWRAA